MAKLNPKRVKARELYEQDGLSIKEISQQLNIIEGTLRGWKSKDKWNENVPEQRSKKENVEIERSGTQNVPKNENLKSFKKGNQAARTHGLYSKYVSSTMKALIEDAASVNRLDLLEDSINIQYANIVQAQNNVDVENPNYIKAITDATRWLHSMVRDYQALKLDEEIYKAQVLDNQLKEMEIARRESDIDPEQHTEYKGIPADMMAPAFIKMHHAIRNNEYKEYLLPGGRGSGKSTDAGLEVVNGIETHPNWHALCVRSVGDRLRTSVYNQIIKAIDMLGLREEYQFKVNPLEIIKKSTGQTIYFRGAANPEDIKSITPSFGSIGILWFEELNQFNGPNSVDSVVASAIRGTEDAIIFKTYNPPKNNTNWVNQYRYSDVPDRLVVESSYLDVPKDWLGQAFIDIAERKKQINPTAYRHEYLGEVTGTGAGVFENLEIREITDEEIKQYDNVLYGLDFGWYPDPTAFVKLAYNSATETLLFIDEFVGNKIPPDILKQEIVKRLDKNRDMIVCDSAAPASINELSNLGLFTVGAKKGPGSRNDGYRFLSSRFKLVIDPKRTKTVYNEFTQKEYMRDKDENIIEGYPDGDDHTIDATRYAVEQLTFREAKMGAW